MNRVTTSARERRLGLVLLIVLLASLFAPLALASAQGEPVAVVTAARLNIRSGPGPIYNSLGTVGRGEVVALLGRNSNSSWAYVRAASGLTGWATTYYLDTTARYSSLPVMTAQAPIISPAQPAASSPAVPATGTATTQYPPVRVNTAAGNEHGIIAYLDGGETVLFRGRNAEGTWLYIQFRNNGLGWSQASRINTLFNISTLPVVNDMEAPVGENLTANILASANQFAPPLQATQPPPGQGGLFVPQPVSGPAAAVNTPVLNVRSGPGPGYDVITKLTQGQLVSVVGRDSAGAWVQIVLPNGLLGWVSSFYLTPAGDLGTLPVEATYEAVGLVVTGALNVRSGPGPWYPRVTVAYQGQMLTLIGRIPSSTWYKVIADGREGWVDAQFIRTNYPVQNLPVFRASAGDF